MLTTLCLTFREVLTDHKGISSLEYGVLAVGIVAVVAIGATNVGTQLATVFTTIVTQLGG